MKYKAIIFDMDGTIVDTEKIWKKANQILIERRGVAYTPELKQELTKRISGLALANSCAIIKDLVQLDEPLDDLIKEKCDIARELYKAGIIFIEGFEDFHKEVTALGLRNAIATNAQDFTIEATDSALNLKRFFGEHIYGISCVDYVCKPNPAVYLHAAEKLGVAPEECLAVEDSAHGIAAAQKAGMFCIGINTAQIHDQVKAANHIVDRYDQIDLQELVKKQPSQGN